METLCQLAGVLYRRMMLLIRMEDVSLPIQAESLVKKPVASGGILLLFLIVGLVTAAGQLSTIPQIQHVTELLCLSGSDIKEGVGVSQNLLLLAVGHRNQMPFIKSR